MARVTVEDCLEKIPSRFALVHLCIERVKQLRKGAKPLVKSDNKEIVQALREIAAGKVTFENLEQLAREAEEERIFQSLQADTSQVAGQ
jgi:DNA-directed RNA polymerase subunit omega